ncbi:MAG: 2-oxoacid:acceptor oxidoreductase family protein [Methylococcales bacterium]|nr:2-oxoacid:acceptor oxidoreductase family protein [Methylococcales bacterium]
MALFGKKKQNKTPKYPGIRTIMNGTSAVIMCERESSDAACSYLSTPSSDMSTLWNQEKHKGHINISNRTLISVSPESNHAAAAATSGLSLSGLRATHFSDSTQSVASMHESLYVAAGKRLPYVLNMTCTATTKATSNIYCSHDDYHSIGDTGFIQFFAHNNQSAADLNLISRKITELSLNPVVLAQDGFLTSHLIEPLNLPERALIEEFIGLPDDIINTPTPAQSILFGKTRRRVPETWTVDQPTQSGGIQNPDSYMQTVAGQRPYFFDHVRKISDQCMDEWFELTGRRYHRVNQYLCQDADYLIIAQGSIINTAEITADFLRNTTRKLNVGVVNLTVFRPFPGDLLSHIIKGKKGILILERTDQPMAEDLPITAEIRSCISKALDNGNTKGAAFSDYANYAKTSDVSPLYSACFGLGGHDIKVNDIVAAVENMLPEGNQHKFTYLGVNFANAKNLSPQQEIQQYAIIEAYPEINNLALKSSETPILLAENTTTIRLHALGGSNNNKLGQSLAQILFDHFDLEVKANPFYGTEKKGQPTTFYLTTSNEPFRLNNEYNSINTIIAVDSAIFAHSDPLNGLVENGTLIIQSSFNDVKDVWCSFPTNVQKVLSDKNIKVYFIDAVSIAQEEFEKTNDELTSSLDLLHLVFKSAFFKTTEITLHTDKTEEQTQSAIGGNPDFIQRCYNDLQELIVTEMDIGDTTSTYLKESAAPLLLQQKPANDSSIASIHRFWNQTGNHYKDKNSTKENLAEPFTALGIVPASTGIFGDMTANRLQHPQWIPENCTACGNCYTSCPDSAIPGLINTVSEIFETNIKRIEKSGHIVKHLRRAIRTVEKKYHELTAGKSVGTTLDPIFAKAIGDTIKEYPEPERKEVTQEFEWFKETIGSFKFALTEPYHDDMNSRMPRNGGLFSITINPNSCKGCIECVSVCETEALTVVDQTPKSVKNLRDNWAYWLDLPTSNKKYSRIDNLQAKNGVLNTLLLDKKNHNAVQSSDTTRSGSGEKIAIHLFSSTITALMQPRIEQHIKRIDQLIIEMEKHIRLQLVATLDISDIDALETAIDENQNVDLTLSRLSGTLDKDRATQPIDPKWLKWALQIVAKLKYLKWSYKQGASGEGRASLGVTEGSHQASVWTATFPYNPYPFPWARHLSQDAPSLAMGIFEGHMVKMAEGFKAIRTAELEIKSKYDHAEHDTFFAHFDWRQFTEEEYLLCPPLVTLNSEGTSFNSGLQNLSTSLTSGFPIKILVLDNQPSQNADSLRKELGLIAMAHRTAFVHQGSISNTTHLLEGYIDGLNYRGPALWSIYASSQPENGIANNSLTMQSRLAVESRAYPLITFNPRRGKSWEECISLIGNPDIDQDWITYSLDYTDEYGNKFSMDVPLTYADWALTESTLSHHFKPIPADAGSDSMVLLSEFIEMEGRQLTDNIPFIWAVHPHTNHLLKVVVSTTLVKATQEQKEFWHTLKGLSGDSRIEVDTQAIADQAKSEMAQTITEGLMSMVGGDAGALSRILADVPTVSAKTITTPETKPAPIVKEPKAEPKPEKKPKIEIESKKVSETAAPAHEPVWIETPDCTTCDECVDIAPAIFQYNEEKKAIVIDPTKGTFEDIVRSAEKCTAVIIHPGTPWNPDEPNLEQLIKRAEKFQ